MDIEWGKDGRDGEIYILQARPETVQSRSGNTLQRYTAQGRCEGAGHGPQHRPAHRRRPARVIRDVAEMARVQSGDVLVADMTDPDWEPVMKRASAIVTNRGGRTCHAAIIARELGIPAVVGCGDATGVDQAMASFGDGVLCRGRHRLRVRRRLDFEQQRIELDNAAAAAGQDHDERRQSGPRFRFRQSAATTAWVSRASSSSSTA
jgi:pyruvate,water dikinase